MEFFEITKKGFKEFWNQIITRKWKSHSAIVNASFQQSWYQSVMFVVPRLGKPTSSRNMETKPHSLRGPIRALLMSVASVSQQNPQGNCIKEFSGKSPQNIYFKLVLKQLSDWPGTHSGNRHSLGLPHPMSPNLTPIHMWEGMSPFTQKDFLTVWVVG